VLLAAKLGKWISFAACGHNSDTKRFFALNFLKLYLRAALLAAKLGKWISFAGSLSSLSLMSVISVAIGAIFSRVGADW
jgi:hypothetical protein